MTAFIQNSLILELVALTSEIDGSFINNATVSVTVTDTAGVEVSGMSWPQAMTYKPASDGIYQLILSDGLALVDQKLYIANVDVDAGTDRKAHWSWKFRGKIRDT